MLPSKTPVPKEDKETKESDKDTDTENETDFSDDDYEPAQVTKKERNAAQDLIDRIKDVKNITEDEALALYSTYAYTNYKEDFYSREENITDEAFKILKDDGYKIPYTTTIRDNMLHSENANVRAYAFTDQANVGTNSEEEKMAEEVLAKETEPVVLFAALRSLGGAVSNPAVAEFVLNMTEHENANVRKQAALA